MRFQILALCLCGLYSNAGFAAELIELEGTALRGEQEQPKVLYLVPWGTPDSPAIEVPEPEKELDGALRPLDRQAFRQSLYYRKNLKIGDLDQQ
ncbi:hypothetical protein EUZ85_20985 [Hahella sp. KA22]|uniref:Uncharacterized protein n=1 Tax=Hahella chejuensis (strain KCTC 2396) TaxID=349521 RepID=Q2SIV5_HAHCH|nr:MULTISPECIES: hypothetical protein [Hahella]ABC29419.1 hypothetical protein HCH_02629 [Hahella chejuensis KCTC 2396]AZZ93074.1 hypothetical protein ENC22_18400 [Hahella sp. KA22]MBU6950521.1 hypothetical protein [Hahella sp. HN01]MDG9667938.1 hypothetical protein [Hahella sp. CR1]QAY56448.1 hypothetical protein EUZ85_20985 [Hahella sp. KA22]